MPIIDPCIAKFIAHVVQFFGRKPLELKSLGDKIWIDDRTGPFKIFQVHAVAESFGHIQPVKALQMNDEIVDMCMLLDYETRLG